MRHYCTYFDRGYLAQGIALWTSLARHDADAMLWVLALDGETSEVLRGIGETSTRVFELGELLAADPALAAIQRTRPRNEFIFTLTSCLVGWLLRTRPEISTLVYLDADLFFFADPAPIWRELQNGSVLVVPHRYPAWHDDSMSYGKFNVGVLGFRADSAARACAAWWRERCLESCALAGDGSCFGDQKYLDEWPRRFAGLVESRHQGVNAAPWNWAGFKWDTDGERVRVDGQELVVFHFAQFRRVHGSWFDSGQLEYGIMPMKLRSRLYGEYWSALLDAENRVRVMRPKFVLSSRGWQSSLGDWRMGLLRAVCGQFWWKLGPFWIAGRMGSGRWVGRGMAAYRRWQHRDTKS